MIIKKKVSQLIKLNVKLKITQPIIERKTLKYNQIR